MSDFWEKRNKKKDVKLEVTEKDQGAEKEEEPVNDNAEQEKAAAEKAAAEKAAAEKAAAEKAAAEKAAAEKAAAEKAAAEKRKQLEEQAKKAKENMANPRVRRRSLFRSMGRF